MSKLYYALILSFVLISSALAQSKDKVPKESPQEMPQMDPSTSTPIAIRSICDEPKKIRAIIDQYEEKKLFDAFGITFVIPPNYPPEYARQLTGITSMFVNPDTGSFSIIFKGEGFSCLILNGNKFTPGGMDQ